MEKHYLLDSSVSKEDRKIITDAFRNFIKFHEERIKLASNSRGVVHRAYPPGCTPCYGWWREGHIVAKATL